MKQNLILGMLIMLTNVICYGQNQNCVNPTLNIHDIAVPASVPKLNGNPLPNGSRIIGVFTSADTVRCSNLITWSGGNNILLLYGMLGSDPGYSNGELIKYRVILPNGAKIENTNIQSSYSSGDPTFTAMSTSVLSTFNITGTSSSEEQNIEANLSISPNPTSGLLKLISENQISELSIINLEGRLVDVVSEIKDNTIDLSHLAPGSYILKGLTNNYPFAKKVVIVK